MPRDDLSLSEARRVALTAQGFDRPRPNGGIAARHLRGVIQRLGLLQLDFVNVLVPSHYLVPFSRLGPYERCRLDDLVYRRRAFTEQWAHEASILPMEVWPLLRHRMAAHRVRPYGFERFMKRHADYARRVLDEVRARGAPTCCRSCSAIALSRALTSKLTAKSAGCSCWRRSRSLVRTGATSRTRSPRSCARWRAGSSSIVSTSAVAAISRQRSAGP